jgi:hypothetical protein
MTIKTRVKSIILCSVLALGAAGVSRAATPVLSISPSGSNGTAQIVISGADSNSMITWYSRQGSNPVVSISNFGHTNSSGYFSQTSSLPQVYNGTEMEQYVIVNGQRSNSVYINSNNFGYNNNYNNCYQNCYVSVSLSQSSVTVNSGQSVAVSIFNNNNNYSYNSGYYVSSNTNSSVATATVSGPTLTIYGNQSGSTIMTLCANSGNYNGGNSCATLYVNVNSNQVSGLTFSQSTVALNAGQNSFVTVYNPYNYTGGYYVSNNSNSNVVSASVSGNSIFLNGISAGSSTLTICQSTSSYNCGTVYVTVSGYNNNNNYGNVSFSVNNPTLTIGQNLNVNLYSSNSYNYGSSFYVSSNSNSGAVSASISGSTLYLRGLNYGSSAIVVCQNSSSQCSTLNVTVNGGAVLGSSTYKNGALVSENGTIYQIYKNAKTAAFANWAAFQGLGYSLDGVINTGYTNLPNAGYIISNSNVPHPWGTWIRSFNTVYFVHESGLIPVSDYNTFLNNGGEDRMIVPANFYDFQKTQQSMMQINDYRLR